MNNEFENFKFQIKGYFFIQILFIYQIMFKILSAASLIVTTFTIRFEHEASIALNSDQQQWDQLFKSNIKAIQNADVTSATTSNNKTVFNYLSPSKTNGDKSTETSTW